MGDLLKVVWLESGGAGERADERVEKMRRTSDGDCPAARRKGILPFATTGMGLDDITLSEMSQREKDKHPVSHSYMCGI